MALQQQMKFKTQFGEIGVNNVYIKIMDVIASKNAGVANLRYSNGKDGNFLSQSSVEFPVSLEGKNFIAQAYDHLKTLPEFSQAMDV